MQDLGPRVRVVGASPLDDYFVLLEFENGIRKKIDLRPFLQGPIFAPVRNDPAMFRDIHIVGGTVAWANGADIDADVLYYDLKPAWMEHTEPA